MSLLKEINGENEWDEFVSSNPNKIIVIQFSTGWCGPCKKIKPFVEEMSCDKENIDKNIIFCKIDADKAQEDLWEWAMVDSLPTFRIFSKGNVIGEYVGSDPIHLKQFVKKLI